MEAFAQALLIGLSIAAPVGPIGLLVIQRSLQRGQAAGLATGLGAALADAIYGAVGAYGVAAVTGALEAARVPLALGGSAFLLWLAWQTWRQPSADDAAALADARSLLGCLAGTLLLTLSNPATIVSFVAIFGMLGTRTAGTPPPVMIAGVLAGSALWWLLLSAAVGRWRHRFDARWRRRVNRTSALAMAAFAAWQLGGLVA